VRRNGFNGQTLRAIQHVIQNPRQEYPGGRSAPAQLPVFTITPYTAGKWPPKAVYSRFYPFRMELGRPEMEMKVIFISGMEMKVTFISILSGWLRFYAGA
jgi:hypothetical protein